MPLETVLHHKQKGGGNGANKNQQVIMNVLSTGCGSFFLKWKQTSSLLRRGTGCGSG
jgi:hypothetical protein